MSLGDLRAGSFFNGVINEVALFNIALSDADIRTLMQGLAVSITAVKLSGNLAITWVRLSCKRTVFPISILSQKVRRNYQ